MSDGLGVGALDVGALDVKTARPIFQTQIDAMGGAERSALALADWLYERGLPAYVLTYGDRVGIGAYAKHPLPVVELMRERGMPSAIVADPAIVHE